MNKKTGWIIVGSIVILALLVGGGWFLSQNQRASTNSYEIQLENQYQRSFHQLASGMDNINAQLAQVLVTTSHKQTLLNLSNLWRQVYGAVNDLSNIPLPIHELENTDIFLNDMAEYSYYLMKKNIMEGKVLSQNDWSQLQEFYNRSKVVKDELGQIEAKILNENLRLIDVAGDMAKADESQQKNQIVSAFRGIEEKIQAFPELEFEEGVRKIEPEPRPIEGEQISQERAIEIATEFLSGFNDQKREAKIEFISEGSKIPIYGVCFYNGEKDTEPIYVEVSQKGGVVLQMYQYREIAEAKYDEEACSQWAKQFLVNMGFPTMAQVDSQSDDKMVDLTFVPVQNSVYLYSDMVKMQVARDNSKLLNYDQTSYATRHYKRDIKAPTLTESEVRTGMNPNFEVTAIRLALIPHEYRAEEILTYEIRGKINKEVFSVFVDAHTGDEVRMVRITEPEQYLVNTSQ